MAEEDALFQKFNLRSLEKELATAVQDEVTRVAVSAAFAGCSRPCSDGRQLGLYFPLFRYL